MLMLYRFAHWKVEMKLMRQLGMATPVAFSDPSKSETINCTKH